MTLSSLDVYFLGESPVAVHNETNMARNRALLQSVDDGLLDGPTAGVISESESRGD